MNQFERSLNAKYLKVPNIKLQHEAIANNALDTADDVSKTQIVSDNTIYRRIFSLNNEAKWLQVSTAKVALKCEELIIISKYGDRIRW